MGVKALALALHTPCYGREGKGEGGHFLLMIFPVVAQKKCFVNDMANCTFCL